MHFRKANITLTGIMVFIAMAILISSVTLFYQTALDQSRQLLARTASSQARLLEAVGKFDQSYSDDYPEGSMAATLSQIREAFRSLERVGKTGEFLLARKQDNKIIFMLVSPGEGRPVPDAVPLDSGFAEPMRRALMGEAGTMVGVDYDGTTVLAAYQPVLVLDWAIVVKIDLAEIRAPFLRTGGILVLFAVFLTLLGSFLFFRISHPLIRQTEESEQRYQRAVAGTSDGLWDWNILTEEGYFSSRFSEILGYGPDELKSVMETFTGLIHPDDKDRVLREIRAHLDHGATYDTELRMRRKNGDYVWVQSRGRAVSNKDGQPFCMAGSITDITERRNAEAALIESEGRYRTMFDTIDTGAILINSDGIIQIFNPAAEEIFGYGSDEVLGKNVSMLMPPPERESHNQFIQSYMDTGDKKVVGIGREVTAVRKSGEKFSARLGIDEIIRSGHKSFVGTIVDLTERKTAEAISTRLGKILEQSINEIYIFDAETLLFRQVNDSAKENLGYGMDELEKLTLLDIKPEFTLRSFRKLIKPLRDGTRKKTVFETIQRRKDGTTYDVEVSLQYMRNETPPIFVAFILDITERKKTAAALAEVNAQFQSAFEDTNQGMTLVGLDRKYLRVNEAFCQMMGYSEKGLLELGVEQRTHPDDLDASRRAVRRLLDGETSSVQVERLYIHKDGHEIPAHVSTSMVRDKDGEPLHFVSHVQDLTALKESEDRLRQAQKMEAVGQLTGGVAHDFNNLLAVIQGNLSLLGDDLDEGRKLNAEALREFIDPALQASRRGADLTHRLLAFSRKQALRPVALQISSVVQGMEGLLKRTLGEDIDLSWHLECVGCLAEADPSELENVLLNLALNARDAMTGGGSMTIETAGVRLDDEYAAARVDVTAGDYVMLAVTDTGIGMDAETLDKVFEPFFTTKDVGKGTGLGLSMVYGFAKQSGGHVAIYSEPGEGTTVKLYLPRTAVGGTQAPERDKKALPKGGDETILVLEDDADVRRMTVRILTRLGYRVQEAGDGQTALDILDKDNHTDLLLTDVVLPGGISGPDVVRLVQEKTPGLKVLYMSGYTENAIFHHGRLDQGVNLISKPFSHIDLGIRIREVLDFSP